MEQELLNYMVETPKVHSAGTFMYLSLDKRNEYLASKGVVRLHKHPSGIVEPIVRFGRGKDYLEICGMIENVTGRNDGRRLGSKGLNLTLIEEDVNKIDRTKVAKIKDELDMYDINPDEIPL